MNPDAIVASAVTFALVVLPVALLLTVVRIIRGPTLADRVLGLDMLVAVAIGLIAVIAIRTGFHLYIDIAIALGLVGFLATIAFARYILSRAGGGAAKGGAGLADAPAGKAAGTTAVKGTGGRRRGKARRRT